MGKKFDYFSSAKPTSDKEDEAKRTGNRVFGGWAPGGSRRSSSRASKSERKPVDSSPKARERRATAMQHALALVQSVRAGSDAAAALGKLRDQLSPEEFRAVALTLRAAPRTPDALRKLVTEGLAPEGQPAP